MNFLINIAGPSGVGKTTIANMLLAISDYDSCVIISGDDAHKWERGHKNWETYTHLDPEANNLQQDYEQLLELKNGIEITRRHYNHSNGLFDQPENIAPKKTIIYEGLHGLYSEQVRSISNLKIYVDTDEELKIAWKLKRDLGKRGYTETQLLENIKRRIKDEEKYILPQKEYADVIARFTFSELDGVNFEFKIINDKFINFFNKIKDFYELKKEFVRVCKQLGKDNALIQNKGGNISLKYDDKIIITSSGHKLSNVLMFDGINILDLNDKKNIIFKHGRPSMELGAHMALGKAVIHTHPTDLMVLLCSLECEEIIKQLYSNYQFSIIEYKTPGNDLAKAINNINSNIIFCKNHGLFVVAESLQEACDITKNINDIAKNYINKNSKEKQNCETDSYLFPDSVVLQEENTEFNNLIFNKIISCNMTPDPLKDKEIEKLLLLEEEKYRSSV